MNPIEKQFDCFNRHGEATDRTNTSAVIASEAKQSISQRNERMDCFVAEFIIGPAYGRTRWLLAMTLRHARHTFEIHFRILAARRARALPEFSLTLEQEGAGKAGCALHPRSRVQTCTKKRTRAYRSSGGNPAFPARWFTAYTVLSLVTGLSCHHRHADISTRLDASVGAPGPHGFAVRVSAVRQRRLRVHRIPLQRS
jgi:hypothetical protein